MNRLAVIVLLLAAPPASGQLRMTDAESRAFDRADREAQSIISTMRCARTVSMLRMRGAFGPIDSLGKVGQCVLVAGSRVGVFMALDSPFVRPTRFSAVDLSAGTRHVLPVDTLGIVALVRAAWNAEERGDTAYEKADRTYAPFSFRFDGDSIEAWLIPANVLMGRPFAVGGERGYVYAPDGNTLGRQVDDFSNYRTVTIADTGVVHFESRQDVVPTVSELILANLLNDSGRRVTIDLRLITATLVGRGAQAAWVQIRKKP